VGRDGIRIPRAPCARLQRQSRVPSGEAQSCGNLEPLDSWIEGKEIVLGAGPQRVDGPLPEVFERTSCLSKSFSFWLQGTQSPIPSHRRPHQRIKCRLNVPSESQIQRSRNREALKSCRPIEKHPPVGRTPGPIEARRTTGFRRVPRRLQLPRQLACDGFAPRFGLLAPLLQKSAEIHFRLPAGGEPWLDQHHTDRCGAWSDRTPPGPWVIPLERLVVPWSAPGRPKCSTDFPSAHGSHPPPATKRGLPRTRLTILEAHGQIPPHHPTQKAQAHPLPGHASRQQITSE